MQVYRIILFILLGVGIGACDRLRWGERPHVPAEHYEAHLQLSVPFADDGAVRVYKYGGDELLVAEGRLQDGYVELALGEQGLGDLIVEVSDLSLTELRTGAVVTGAPSRWRAPLPGVETHSVRTLVMTPWNHIAWIGSAESMTAYDVAWAPALEELLSCGTGFADLLTTMPYDPDSGASGDALSPATWAYLLWGGWSELAVWLSEQANLPANARIHSQSLMDGVALDVSYGSLDGVGPGGMPVELAAGLRLPADLLRQPLAQSVRRFANSRANATSLDSSAIVDALRCISISTGGSLGAQSGPLDLEGAEVTSMVPVVGATLKGRQDYRCEAEDALSDIVEMRVAAMRAGGRLEPMVTEGEVTFNGRKASYSAVLSTTSVPDGDVTMACTAVDMWGNEGVHETPIGVNNQAGSAVVLEPTADSVIQGDRVLIRCGCDDEYLEDCYLSQPPADSRSVIDIDDDRYLLDTTRHPDGLMPIECSAKSAGLEPTSGSVQVEVDNLDPTTWSGVVALDSPVVGATVDAQIVYDDASLGPVFATTTTNGMGRFALNMPDSVSGRVLLTAYGIDATFRNGAVPMQDGGDGQRGAVVRFRATDKLWLLENPYYPRRPGQPREGLSINLYSSAVAKLALSLHARGDALGAAVAEADYQIGHIFDRERGMYVGRTLVRDFVTESDFAGLTDRASTRLGLGHVGLSRRGAEIAIEAGDDPNSLNSLYMLPYILRDLENAILDGLDGNDTTINVTPLYDLNHLTLRWELATAIGRWLDNEPLGATAVAMNRTSLTSTGYSGEGGFVRLMAENASPLFGDAPYRPFDHWGPEVTTFELQEPSGRRINADGGPVRGDITLVISAYDPSGFAGTPVEVSVSQESLGQIAPQFLLVRDVTLDARYVITTATLTDGSHSIVVRIYDSIGNVTDRTIPILTDNTQPVVHIVSPEDGGYISRPNVDVVVEVHGERFGLRSISINDSTVNEPEGYSATILVSVPGDSGQITASAVDIAGNTSEVETHHVKFDVHDPYAALNIQPTPYEGWVGRTLTSVECVADDSQDVQPSASIVFDPPLGRSYADDNELDERITRYADVSMSEYADQQAVTASCIAQDHVGRTDTDTLGLRIDANGPAFDGFWPASGSWVMGPTMDLVILATDERGILSVTCDGWKNAVAQADGSWLCRGLDVPSDNQQEPAGTTHSVEAYDNVGNVTATEVVYYGDINGPSIRQMELRDVANNPLPQEALEEPIGGSGYLNVVAEDPRGFGANPRVRIGLYDGSGSNMSLDDVLGVREIVGQSDTELEVRYFIDYTRIPDGTNYAMRAWATDSLGNETTIPGEVVFSVDNTPPILLLHGDGVVRTRNVTIGYQITESMGVAKLELNLGADSVPDIDAPALTGERSIALPSCDETFTLTGTVVNSAGLRSAPVSLDIRCDESPAELTMEPSKTVTITDVQYGDDGELVYRQGEGPSLRDLGWPGSVIELEGYANQLDAWSPYVQVIDFYASEAVSVTYRYSINEKVVHEAELAPNAHGVYQLPIAYQTLLPDNATPDTNEMAFADPEDVHRVEVEMVDEAGNPSVYEFPFRHSLKVPPVAIRNCRVSSRATDATLTPPTVHELFDSSEAVPLLDADVIWATDIQDDSLMPREPVELSIPGGFALTIWRYGSRVRYRSGWEPATDYPCHYIRDMHQADPAYCSRNCCAAGLKTVDTSESSSSGRGVVNHPATVTFRMDGTAITGLPPNAHWNTQGTRSVSFRIENLLTGEADWDWPVEGGEYRVEVLETGYDYTYRPQEFGDRMMMRRYAVLSVPTSMVLRGSPVWSQVRASHPVAGDVDVVRLGTCRDDSLSHVWNALPSDDSAGGGR